MDVCVMCDACAMRMTGAMQQATYQYHFAKRSTVICQRRVRVQTNFCLKGLVAAWGCTALAMVPASLHVAFWGMYASAMEIGQDNYAIFLKVLAMEFLMRLGTAASAAL